MDIRWIENARREFVGIYGEKRGLAVCNAVMPGVMGDFRKTVLKADDGGSVRETYRVDDQRATVVVSGRRQGETCIVTRIEINGVPLDLGGETLTLA